MSVSVDVMILRIFKILSKADGYKEKIYREAEVVGVPKEHIDFLYKLLDGDPASCITAKFDLGIDLMDIDPNYVRIPIVRELHQLEKNKEIPNIEVLKSNFLRLIFYINT